MTRPAPTAIIAPVPAAALPQTANGSGVLGLYPASDFRITTGDWGDGPTIRQALWYFRDETIALRRHEGGYRACATPFFGEAGPVPTQAGGEAPLTALFFLSKSTRFAHRRLARQEAVQRAFPQVFLPKRSPAMAEAILASLDAVTAAVPCFELEFAARDELWSYVDAVA